QVVEEAGLQAPAVERDPGRAVGRAEDSPVVAAVDDGGRGARRPEERPGVGVRMQAGKRSEVRASIRGAALTDAPDVNDVGGAVARRGRVDGHVKAVAALGIAGHTGGRALDPVRALVGAEEQSDWVRGAASSG